MTGWWSKPGRLLGMPRRQTGYQVFKPSVEHCVFKWLGLLLLYKSLINKSLDKDSALKKFLKIRLLLQVSSSYHLNFLETRVTEFKYQVVIPGPTKLCFLLMHPPFSPLYCLVSCVNEPSLEPSLLLHVSCHPEKVREKLWLVKQSIHADLVWQHPGVWHPQAPRVPSGGLEAESPLHTCLFWKTLVMNIIHNHLQIYSETSRDSKFEGQVNKLLKAYAYKKQNIQKSIFLTFISFLY